MRKAAIAAGIVQLLSGLFTAAPQIFGTSFSSAPGQAAFRIFTAIACLALATFFVTIVLTPVPKVSGAVRVASVVAVATVTEGARETALRSIRDRNRASDVIARLRSGDMLLQSVRNALERSRALLRHESCGEDEVAGVEGTPGIVGTCGT